MRGLEWRVGRLICLSVAAGALALAGCGGGGGTPTNLPAVSPQTTGTFRTSAVKVLVGGVKLVSVGDGYVTLTNGVPVEVGFDLPAGAVTHISPARIHMPALYAGSPSPQQVYTPLCLPPGSFLA